MTSLPKFEAFDSFSCLVITFKDEVNLACRVFTVMIIPGKNTLKDIWIRNVAVHFQLNCISIFNFGVRKSKINGNFLIVFFKIDGFGYEYSDDSTIIF